MVTIGSNTAESHPVLATRVKRAHKLNGQKLIVADIRKHEMATSRGYFHSAATLHGHCMALAVARYIIESGLQKTDFVNDG